jgi:hypothetical protein
MKRCRGYELGQKCFQHADCNPEYICSYGKCMPTVPIVIFIKFHIIGTKNFNIIS